MKLINADCITAMKEMLDNSVDSIVTDPPYELGFMGKSWDSSGIAFNVDVWQEALRVLKPGGHLIAFSGSRTYHRMAVAIEDAGFEIRDQIMWVYGSGFPKSLNIAKALDKTLGVESEIVGYHQNPAKSIYTQGEDELSKEVPPLLPTSNEGKQWQGWGTALKPAHEPMVLARKPLIGTVANNVLTYGTGGLNIDASRVEGEVPSVPMAEWTRSGTTGSSDKRNGEMSQPHSQGRWPANFIHDGSDEVLALFPDTKATGSGKVSGFRKGGASENAVGLAGKKNAADGFSDSGSAARFFYCAKASKRDRNEGLDGFEVKRPDTRSTTGMGTFDEKGVAAQTNHHPTVKPTDLMRYLCRLITPPNGTVLDPFMGSGSTGKACAYEGFDFIGIEQSAEYVEIAKARIEWAKNND